MSIGRSQLHEIHKQQDGTEILATGTLESGRSVRFQLRSIRQVNCMIVRMESQSDTSSILVAAMVVDSCIAVYAPRVGLWGCVNPPN